MISLIFNPLRLTRCSFRRPFKGVRKGGLGLKPTLELDIFKNVITCAKEINCFRILLLVNLPIANTTELICMQISRNIANGPKSNN